MVPDDARAQFVCAPALPGTPGADISCTITGDLSGTGPFVVEATGAGNAGTVNALSGIINSLITTAESGNAMSVNAGVVSGLMETQTSNGGNATSTNTGTAVFFQTQTTNGGNALASNSGFTFVIDTQAIDGNAITWNSGSAFQITTFAQGGNAATTNSGSVSGTITTSAYFGNATTVNTGSVQNLTNANVGIMTRTDGGGDATSINRGSVQGGIYTVTGYNTGGGGNATTINYGTVTTGLVSESGFAGGAGDASVTNYGRVRGSVGAYVDDAGTATITNAGLIDGVYPGGFPGGAVNLRQTDSSGDPNPFIPTTLNILPGSRIIGFIDLNGDSSMSGSGTQVNIFSGHDISSVLTFGGGCNCGPYGGLIDTGAKVNVFGGAPYVIHNNTVAVLDPTSFAAQDRNVLGFTRTVLSAASSRLSSPAPMSGDGSAAIGFAPSGNVARDMANDAFANVPALSYAGQDRVLRSNPNFTTADGTSVWAQGFGGVRVQSADAPNLRSVNEFYGGILGLDKTVQPGLKIGGFVGGGHVTSQIDMNSGRTASDAGFGGLYGRYAMNNRAFLDFALIAGGSSNDVKRTMTNNLVAGGYDYASANYSGWFVSPELAYGVKQDLARNWTVTPTVRVRYLAANFGGYQETGSSTNLTVAGRTTHHFEERGELVFTRTTREREGSLLQINATLGAMAWQRVGDAMVNTVLLGQALAFVTPGKANVFGGYFGGGFDWRTASGFSVFGAAEVTAMSDSSHAVTGRGGVKLAF